MYTEGASNRSETALPGVRHVAESIEQRQNRSILYGNVMTSAGHAPEVARA